MKNQLVADVLYQVADLLDIKGEIFFKTRAYRMAAQKIETLNEDIETVVKENRLREIPGVGEALAKKIKELVETGRLEYFEKLKKEIPPELLKMLDISGLGPKKIAAVYNKLGIKTIEELRKAAEEGKLRNLEGFGEITEKNILRGIRLMDKTSGRVLLNVAYHHGNKYIEYLKKHKKIKRLSLAGSLRRMKETIGDIDILASSDEPDEIMDYFVKYYDVQRILMKGSTKSSVVLNDELQVDLRVVDDKSFGAALQYFTGSKEHNVQMRNLAIKKGFKLNEYGLFKKNTDTFITGRNEEEIYKKLGLAFIEPELRENRGEIEAAKENKLPRLVKHDDIKGDLHVHSNYSDGFETIEAIAEKSLRLGYQYVGITDHSQSLRVAHGLSKEQIVKKKKEIEKINKKLDNFRILCGTECDIKPDGTLDYDNSILKMFDFVMIGIHTSFKMSRKEATNRIIRGMENRYVNILAHPTCRLMMKREPLDLDMEKIFEAAKETNTYLEINAFPDRLDLNDYYTKLAKEQKVKFTVGTDAHSLNHMDFMRYGVATARRGWLEKKDILNTCTLKEIERIFEL
ncbi:MAG TPA: DNA polymerase/3'-5' exonuclease PolX [Thermoplasmatales archaeon]|nr:DNA polymerase/3'-5' exonuclease PolX [Thermoplasmatales archaeon]